MSRSKRLSTRIILRDFSILYAVTFLIILPYWCSDLHHSWYFRRWKDETQAREQLEQENKLRVTNSELYLKALDRERLLHSPDDVKDKDVLPDSVTIAIITHARTRYFAKGTDPKYLTQNVVQFLKILQEPNNLQILRFTLLVCNVDPDPGFHKEAAVISGYVRVVNRFNKLTLPMVHPKEKEKQDYQFCLNRTLSFNSEFLFLVEDDALPMDDTLKVLEKTVQKLFKQSTSHVSYIKFYHPERLLGYLSASVDRIFQLVSLAGLLAFFCTHLYHHRRKLVTLTLFFVYFTLCALSIGHSNIIEVFRCFSPFLYSTVPAPSCCTQAILFPASEAADLVQYMDRATCGNSLAKDDVIERWSKDRDLAAYLVQPGTFTHIGMYSALRNQIVDPFLL